MPHSIPRFHIGHIHVDAETNGKTVCVRDALLQSTQFATIHHVPPLELSSGTTRCVNRAEWNVMRLPFVGLFYIFLFLSPFFRFCVRRIVKRNAIILYNVRSLRWEFVSSVCWLTDWMWILFYCIRCGIIGFHLRNHKTKQKIIAESARCRVVSKQFSQLKTEVNTKYEFVAEEQTLKCLIGVVSSVSILVSPEER